MSEPTTITGRYAALPIDNLDTDQIMPKQFLRGIDKAGLAQGLLYDHRFDALGEVRPDFVLNRPEFAKVQILVGGANFGCGSSREHAVWGLQQYGIRAVLAPSFGEIFYSNAMNNGLLLVMLPPELIARLMADAQADKTGEISIDLQTRTVRSAHGSTPFDISSRHHRMLLEGLDVIGLSLTYREQITAFSKTHWAQQPWLKDVAQRTVQRLRPGAGE